MLNRNALVKQSIKSKNPVSQSIVNISQYYEPIPSSPSMSVQQRPLMIPSIQVLSVSGVIGQDDKHHYHHQNQESIILSRIQNNGNRSQIEKIIQIEEQQREIQKVAEELIVLRDVVKRLKMSLGAIVQEGDMDFIQGAEIDNKWAETDEYDENNFCQSKTHSATLRLSSTLTNYKITPEYKQWIIQYLNKLFNDIRQIKGMFLQRKNTATDLQSNKSPNNFNEKNVYNTQNPQSGRNNQTKNSASSSLNQPYLQLVEYQIKCRLIETVLKLCRSKNILSQQQTKKFMNQINITPINSITTNLNTHKLTTLIQKINSINNPNNHNNQHHNNSNSNHSIEQLFYKWKTIHDQLEIINIQEIQRFYLQKKKAQKQNYHNNDNGILIIGGSGSGKTTLWLAMAGEKMIKKKIKSKNGEIQNYQAADQEVANKYKTSPFATSCTRQPAKLQAPKRYTFPEQLCLIDTAGFQQSRSGQIDIMNTLYTYQTIQEMKKLRIIIVVSQKNIGQRQQQLIKFAKYVGRYFRDYEQVRESILFVLTKFESIKRLRVACDNVLKHVQIDRESNQYKFLKHLQQSIVYKQCIQFKPTEEKIIFQADYHIDPIQMDSKLKKIYKALLKKFPFHHQYENDYINLQYSKQTRDKLISKRCYLQNMIRRLYKEGNNCYRFYLQQLLFLQSKVNKLEILNHGYISPRDNTRQNENGQGLQYSIIQFIEQINAQLVQKFNFLVQDYLKTCDSQVLNKILQIRDKCQRIYCEQNSFQGINNDSQEMIDDDDDEYHYVLRQIVQSINGLKNEIERIVDERVREWAKVMKYKAKWCHDVGNKRWLCAVVNFTKMYFAEQSSEGDNKQSNQKQNKNEGNQKGSLQSAQRQGLQHMTQSSSQEYNSLIKTLRKTQQKFRSQLTQELNLINQQITNFLIRQQQQSTQKQIDEMFVKQTVNEMKQAINGFKRLVFYQYLEMNESQVGKDDKLEVNRRFKNNEKDVVDKFNNKSKDKSNNNQYNKNRAHQANFMTKPQPKQSSKLLIPPSDQHIILNNTQFITQTIQTILTKQQQQIITNLQLIQSLQTNDQQITISLWLQVERFVEKVKMLKQVDDGIGEMAIKVQKNIVNRVDIMVRNMVAELAQVVKKQYDQQVPIIMYNNNNINNNTYEVSNNLANNNKQYSSQDPFTLLPSAKLYNYLSKLNELQQFESFSTFLNFEIKCFQLKLKDYSSNLYKQLDKYDEQLGWMRKSLMLKGQNIQNVQNIQFTQPVIYQKIKNLVTSCIQLSQQLKLINHYIGQSQSISELQKINNQQEQLQTRRSKDSLRFLNCLFYRHERFLQCEKKSLRQQFLIKNNNNFYYLNSQDANLKGNNNNNNNNSTLSQLLLDYLILEQTHHHLIKSTHSHYHRTLLLIYEKSYQSLSINHLPSSISMSNNHFHTLIVEQIKVLNQYKQKILQKLISYPLELLSSTLQQIQTEQFHNKLDTNVIMKTTKLFMYFIKLRSMFQTIQGLNNQQIAHDYRVIDVQDIMQPLDQLDDTLQQLSNLLITVIEITRLKFMEIKQSLISGVLLDQQMCQLISTYIKNWHILVQLNTYLQTSSITNLELLEESLQQLTHYHNITSQLKQFIDRSQSIFYRLSKNIDSIELQHLQIQQLTGQPQSVNQFIKSIKKQAIFLYQQLESYQTNQNQQIINTKTSMDQMVHKLSEFIKKMQDSENVIDSIWQDELKQLESQTNDPKNSLHKIIKLYEQHITKVSIQKTLEYKFVQLKKQQLSDQIKEYLEMPPADQAVDKGQLLCEQLKNYLQFLKSMRLKMVVAINDMDQIKNIQEMERLYEKETSRSQAAQRSQTDMTPSQLRENYLSVDYVQTKKENSQRYSVSDVKTSHFGINSGNRGIERKSAMKKSRQWDEKSNGTDSRQHRHSTNVNMMMDNSFSSVADQWSRQLQQQHQQKDQQLENVRQYTINNAGFNTINHNNIRRQTNKRDSRNNTYIQPSKPQLFKSQSEIEFRSNTNIPININNNVGNSMIDNYDTIVTTTQGYKVNNNNNNNNLSTINANSLNYNKNYSYNKSAKTIQMSASTPYMQSKTISNRVIPTNNNNNTNTITKPYQYSNNQQQRSSIILNSNINVNDNNDNNFDSNETKSKFSYSQKYMTHNNNSNNAKKYTINGHNRTETSQSLNVQPTNNNNHHDNDKLKVTTTSSVANMKKSTTMLKYAPPTLIYDNNQSQKSIKPTTPMTARTTNNNGLLSPNLNNNQQPINQGSSQNFIDTGSKNGALRMMTKYKTEKKL